jgi:hypothetical protein
MRYATASGIIYPKRTIFFDLYVAKHPTLFIFHFPEEPRLMGALNKSHDDGRLSAAAWRILAIPPLLSIRETLRTLLEQNHTVTVLRLMISVRL